MNFCFLHNYLFYFHIFFSEVFSFYLVFSILFIVCISYWYLGILKSLFVQQLTDIISDEESFENDGDGGWPFQTFVEQLLVDMFDPGK